MNSWFAARPERPTPPRAVLDLCCGGGGAARGYRNAGFAVWGVDVDPRMEQDYRASGAERFICANALDVLADRLFVRHFDLVHISPPCQHFSQMSRCRPGLADTYPDLITPGRELLLSAGVPFVIENVSGARNWMRNPATLCGTMFDRRLYRHRLFEPGNGIKLTAPVQAGAVKGNRECGWPHLVPTARAGHWEPGKFVSVSGHERRAPVREAMGIDWMRNRDDVADSVPPYMTAEVGRQVLAQWT